MTFSGQQFAVLLYPGPPAEIASSSVFQLRIDLSPKPIHLAIAATDQPATMSDLAPVARELATIISKTVVDNLRAQGRDVTCKKGCDWCCLYLVSLAPAEAFRLAAEINNLDEPNRQQTLGRFDQLARKILATPPPEPAAQAIDNWCRSMDLTCPFLKDHLCQQYQIRPIVCREYIVTTPASHCHQGDTGKSETVIAVPSIAEALVELAGELEQATGEAVMLPLAIAWAKTYSHRSRRTWPAKHLAQRFVATIQTAADRFASRAA